MTQSKQIRACQEEVTKQPGLVTPNQVGVVGLKEVGPLRPNLVGSVITNRSKTLIKLGSVKLKRTMIYSINKGIFTNYNIYNNLNLTSYT